jgi:hypothetical protein
MRESKAAIACRTPRRCRESTRHLKNPARFFSAACDCRFSEAPMRAQYFQSLLKSLREWAEPRFK